MPVPNYDWQAPRWELELADGTLLPEARKRMIGSIEVKASIDGADELVLQAQGIDPESREFRFLGENILKPGNRVVAFMGYGSELKGLQRFTMARHRVSFEAGSMPSITMRGYSAEADLVESTQARAFENVRDSEVVAQIADEHGLTYTGLTLAQTSKTITARLKKKGVSDLAFIQDLAARYNFGPPLVRYDANKGSEVIYFRDYDLSFQREIVTLRHDPFRALSDDLAGTLHSFTADLSLSGVPTKVEVVGWAEESQQPIKVVLSITESGQRSEVLVGYDQVGKVSEQVKSGAQLRVAVLNDNGDVRGDRREVVAVRNVKTEEQALAWAERWFQTRQRAYMRGRFKCQGYQGLWVPQIHRFAGLSPEFDGLWELETVTHKMDASGYTCSGDCRAILQEASPTEGT